MARLSSLFIAFFIILIAFAFFTETSNAGLSGAHPLAYHHPGQAGAERSVPIQDCPKACEYRCSEASRRDRCLFYCNLCCRKCLCVPSGTSGHKEECPCYNNWKNKKGTPKCP